MVGQAVARRTEDDPRNGEFHKATRRKRRKVDTSIRLGLSDDDGGYGEEGDGGEGILRPLPKVLEHSADEILSSRIGIPASSIQTLRKTATIGTSHIITSSKMEQRIGFVLKFFNHLVSIPAVDDVRPQQEKVARIMILTCHEKAISKLVSIVELVKSNKAEAARDGKGNGIGNGYWQYNKIVPKTIELKESKHPAKGEPRVADPAPATSSTTADIRTDGSTHNPSGKNPPSTTVATAKPTADGAAAINDEEDSTDFEIMLPPNHHVSSTQLDYNTQEVKRKPKIRVVPTLAVCLATTSVPALEEHGFRLQGIKEMHGG